MKLRNKKTGEIQAVQHNVALLHFSSGKTSSYHSLAELNEDWEDYKDPLIKDKKVRKAVRAWWETIPDAITDKRVLYTKNQDLVVGVYTIYCGTIYPETLEAGKIYTITELCGKEEE